MASVDGGAPKFPAACRPGAAIFLDDEAMYLESIADLFPRSWYLRLFDNPMKCLSVMKADLARVQQDIEQHELMADVMRTGQSPIPLLIQYMRDDAGERFSLPQVVVIDYQMPGMNGLVFARSLEGWLGGRILLTGTSDMKVANIARSANYIDTFMTKQTRQIGERLAENMLALRSVAIARMRTVWGELLSPEQQEVLCLDSVVADLHDLIKRYKWVEYTVVSAPFGILASTSSGTLYWVKLETAAASAAYSNAVGQVPWMQARRRQSPPLDSSVPLALGGGKMPPVVEKTTLGADLCLRAEIHQVEEDLSPGYESSYRRFLERRPIREIE